MKIHKNASLTPKQRQLVKTMYETGQHTQASLANQFNVTRKTISKWINRPTVEDAIGTRKSIISRITSEFEADVKSYRENLTTSHHGKVRIAFELSSKHACSNPSNVYTVLKRLQLNKAKAVKVQVTQQLPVGKHRTQMDIQTLPAIKGNEGYEYKISIIHLSTRIKYSEIHDNFESKTIAQVYERSLENLPPFL
jgi:DNA-binding XRE family transcriptional regulator